jgi:hypothetical protein
MSSRLAVSVILVNWNTRDLLRTCLASVREHLPPLTHEIIVVDNGSGDGSGEMVAREFAEVQLVQNGENLGFGRANNVGMQAARGEFLLLLNTDACLVDDGLHTLVAELRRRPEVGLAGPRLVGPNGALQASAHRFVTLGRLAMEELGLYKLLPHRRVAEMFLGGYWGHAGERVVDWVSGACMLVRREVFEQTGGFDPTIFLYGEDEEWCERVRRAGWSVLFSPVATVLHLRHGTTDRYLGQDVRVGRCLRASGELVRRRQGTVAAATAGVLRVVGALLKLSLFGARRLVQGKTAQGDEARWLARTVLTHYWRHWRNAGLGAR